MKIQMLIVGLAILCTMPSCSRPGSPLPTAQDPANVKKVTSVGVVRVTTPRVSLTQGESIEGSLILNIENGYHVNANPPTYSYLKATELEVAASDGVSATSISYPPALMRKFSFEEKELAVYEGETTLRVTLKTDPSARKGERHLSGKLRIQACDNEVCYPPGSMDVNIPVEVR
jgi:hypothetical protein